MFTAVRTVHSELEVGGHVGRQQLRRRRISRPATSSGRWEGRRQCGFPGEEPLYRPCTRGWNASPNPSGDPDHEP